MVKHSSAAFAMLCTAFVVPCSGVAFAMPVLMGPHSEHLSASAVAALVLVFGGITLFRFGQKVVTAVMAKVLKIQVAPASPPPAGICGLVWFRTSTPMHNQ